LWGNAAGRGALLPGVWAADIGSASTGGRLRPLRRGAATRRAVLPRLRPAGGSGSGNPNVRALLRSIAARRRILRKLRAEGIVAMISDLLIQDGRIHRGLRKSNDAPSLTPEGQKPYVFRAVCQISKSQIRKS